MEVLFYILLFVLGACFGSFLCCQARRLHLRTSTKTKKSLGPRSVCLHCKNRLKWYDNLPIISWLILRGKCRKCHHKIGLAEFISELGTGLALLAIGTTIDITTADAITWASFVTIIIFTLTLIFLAIYDGLYGQLPTTVLIVAIVIACIILALHTAISSSTTAFSAELIWQPFLAVLILGGLYLILYIVSRGKWVGDGDWLLGTAIAIALGSPWLALVVLFLSNFLACFIMLPAFLKRRQHKIYFGPFMVVAFIIAITFSEFLVRTIGR